MTVSSEAPPAQESVYLQALQDESNRRRLADVDLQLSVGDVGSDVRELRSDFKELKGGVGELKGDVRTLETKVDALTTSTKRNRAALGSIVAIAAGVAPEIVKIIKHLLGIAP